MRCDPHLDYPPGHARCGSCVRCGMKLPPESPAVAPVPEPQLVLVRVGDRVLPRMMVLP